MTRFPLHIHYPLDYYMPTLFFIAQTAKPPGLIIHAKYECISDHIKWKTFILLKVNPRRKEQKVTESWAGEGKSVPGNERKLRGNIFFNIIKTIKIYLQLSFQDNILESGFWNMNLFYPPNSIRLRQRAKGKFFSLHKKVGRDIHSMLFHWNRL